VDPSGRGGGERGSVLVLLSTLPDPEQHAPLHQEVCRVPEPNLHQSASQPRAMASDDQSGRVCIEWFENEPQARSTKLRPGR
jgi:hypothetical protein